MMMNRTWGRENRDCRMVERRWTWRGIREIRECEGEGGGTQVGRRREGKEFWACDGEFLRTGDGERNAGSHGRGGIVRCGREGGLSGG